VPEEINCAGEISRQQFAGSRKNRIFSKYPAKLVDSAEWINYPELSGVARAAYRQRRTNLKTEVEEVGLITLMPRSPLQAELLFYRNSPLSRRLRS